MMLTMIDFWLLQWLEKAAQRWQKLTGKNCFWLPRTFIVWGAMNLIGPYQLDILEGRGSTVPILVTCVVLVFAIGMWRESKRNEKEVSRMSGQGYANPFKISDFYFRVIWLLLAIFTISILPILLLDFPSFQAYDAFFVLNYTLSWVLYKYFLACDPLPPAKSKVKKWKEKFMNSVKGVFAPTPQPSPVPCE